MQNPSSHPKVKLNESYNKTFLDSFRNTIRIALIGVLLMKGDPIISQHTNKILDQDGLSTYSKHIDSNNGSVQNIFRLMDLDSLSHEEIIRYPIKTMIKYHGMEKAQEIIKEHMLIEINKIRKAHHLHTLMIDHNLTDAAVLFVKELSENKRQSHYSKNGDDWTKRARDAGYQGSYVREIIGFDYYSISAVIEGWENSSGHYKEIKDRRQRKMGFACSEDGKCISIMFGNE